MIAIECDAEFLVDFVLAGDNFIDVGSESKAVPVVRLRVVASRRHDQPVVLSVADDLAGNDGGQGARRDRDDFVIRGGSMGVGRDTGYLTMEVTDDAIAEPTEYGVVTLSNPNPDKLARQTRIRILDEDFSYMSILNDTLVWSQKFTGDVEVVACKLDGTPYTDGPLALLTLYQGATALAFFGAGRPLPHEVKGIIALLEPAGSGTWNHDGVSGTAVVPYTYEEGYRVNLMRHDPGFDYQIGNSRSDADCSVNFGGPIQRF